MFQHPPQSIFNAHGPAAARIAGLSWGMTLLFLFATLVMWLLFAYVFRPGHRGTLAEHAPIDAGGGEAWIAIGGVAIPLLVLTVLFVLGLQLLRAFPIHGLGGGASAAQMRAAMKPEIRIVGHQWWWEIHYLNDDPALAFTTANELELPSGRAVNIEVETADVLHSFWVPALHGKVDLIPGQANYIRLDATDPGTYPGQCGTFCGSEHARMRLLAVVKTPTDYAAWLAAQRLPAAAAALHGDVASAAGAQLFLAGPCATCHTLRGTAAAGTAGPDLTHLASRQMIASDTYPNNTAYLEAWVTSAQTLKPGAKMPNLPQFSGEDLQNLVTFLRQLR